VPSRKSSKRSTEADVALVTCRGPKGHPAEDARLAVALRRHGRTVAQPIWDDPSVDWSAFRIAVVRSTWDYFHRRDDFLRWVERASAHVDLWNRPRTLRWNTDKRYLRDLERAGVPAVPTLWIPRGGSLDPDRLPRSERASPVVVKPAVSAAGEQTFRFADASSTDAWRTVERLASRGWVMVQSYLESVETIGERSLMFLGGRYSHAVRRTPLFPRRVRRRRETLVPASAALRRLAADTIRACPEELLYARVDLVRDRDRRWRLLELEVTEPSLFFGPFPRGAETLAVAIDRRLAR
jgi:glutathione synthase/RimK-type ligase-like ATP-grasp enzyme